MRTVALISGGKDSCYNILQCIAAGHEIVALANLHPPNNNDCGYNTATVDEMDSYMYQTVGHDAIALYSEATGIPLYRETIRGKSVQQGSDYKFSGPEDEVEDLYRLLSHVKETKAVEAVSVGAILSNYQRVRVENVCGRLGLVSLSYLWQRDQEELLEEMIGSGMNAILIKVAALGLDPKKHLGRSIQQCQNELTELKGKFGLNVCGEGGEYETLTLDCPIFKKMIVVEESEIVPHSKDPFAPVAYLKFPKLSLADKDPSSTLGLNLIRKPEDFCRFELDSHDDEKSQEASPLDHVFKKADVVPFLGSSQTNSGIIFISGLVVDSESDFQNVMNILQGIIENHGSNMKAVLSVCLYIRDMADYPRINTVYGQYFDLNPPARVCVEVPIACYAVIEATVTLSVDLKRSLHVQSISHWAPANIGPYSQCVATGDLLAMSGQIGLIPGSMSLPKPANFVAECRLALRHVTRVLCVMDGNVSLFKALQVVCFVCDAIHIAVAKMLWTEYGGDPDQPIAFVVTRNLPRNALVEWQVWTHRIKGSTEKLTVMVSPSKQAGHVYVTKCGEATALLCQLSNIPADTKEWSTLYQRLAQQLGQNHALRIFYKSGNDFQSEMLSNIVPESIATTLIPVCGLEPEHAALICGINV
ncbi:putative diphthine--ammonia ligase [Daphnia sinensis]|uniref:Diphthine--ammonia ligase n=1 Tax=Daphnia sinensis TaxID=1820382 RepID=A0AAD5PZU2_9CRUS|nr:putative diphthine--ammonia ligase [Daphnia sinensis]